MATKKHTGKKKTTPRQASKPAKKKTAKKKTAKKKTAKKKTSSSSPPALVNHVAFVVDRSGSMAPISDKIVEVVNAQLSALKGLAKTTQQETLVSLHTFHSEVDAPRLFAAPVSTVRALRGLRCRGMTALFDATGTAIHDLRGLQGATNPSTSFLVVVLTDGHENASKAWVKKLPPLLTTTQKTGRWSFAFFVPQGGIAACQRLGIPDGNVKSWTATSAGAEVMGRAMTRAIQRFYAARGKGQRSSTQLLSTSSAKAPPA